MGRRARGGIGGMDRTHVERRGSKALGLRDRVDQFDMRREGLERRRWD